MERKERRPSKIAPIAFFCALILLGVGVFGASMDDDRFDETSEKLTNFLTFDKSLGNREDFRKLHKEVEQSYESYVSDGDKRNSVYSYLPKNKATDLYVTSFVNRLAVLYDEMDRDKARTGENEVQEKVVEKYSQKFNKLQNNFLAGSDFEPIKNYKTLDGIVVNDDGKNRNNLSDLSKKWMEKEKKARDYSVPFGADDYRKIGEDIADIFGVEVVYGFDKISSKCVANEDKKTDDSNIVGKFCNAEEDEDKVFVNDKRKDLYGSSSFVDTVKHELSHRLIDKRCGTTAPEIVGNMSEGVTSSYAVIYLGANFDNLQSVGRGNSEYYMTDKTNSLARGIHDKGLCFPK